MAKGKKKSFE